MDRHTQSPRGCNSVEGKAESESGMMTASQEEPMTDQFRGLDELGDWIGTTYRPHTHTGSSSVRIASVESG